MIELTTLTNTLESGLNENTLGITFALFSDTAKYQEATRNRNTVTQYLNGIMNVVDSKIIPAQGLIVATQTARLEFVMQIDDTIETKVATVRAVISNYFQTVQTQIFEDTDDKLYSVSVTCSLPTSGTTGMRSGVGQSYTLVAYIFYTFIENGVNSLNCLIKFNGTALPYTSAAISRVPVVEGNAFSNSSGIVKNYPTVNAVSVDLTLPALATQTGVANNLAPIYEYILSGTQSVNTLAITVDTTTVSYSVIFGTADIALEGVQNAGIKVSFVQSI